MPDCASCYGGTVAIAKMALCFDIAVFDVSGCYTLFALLTADVKRKKYKANLKKEKKMKKKILYLALTAMLLVCFVFVFASCGSCTSHVDPDGDGKCNNCGAVITASDCTDHVDDDDDGYCDNCGETMEVEICYHETDLDGDNICDDCGADLTVKQEMKPKWESQTIMMQLNKCSNNSELSSTLERYVAGAGGLGDAVDQQVSRRNIAATTETKVSVDYAYWDDDSTVNQWGETIQHIQDKVTSSTLKAVPDVYSTYIYDMVGASVKGLFANLKGTSRGSGNLKGLNYFEFVYDRYNYEKEYTETANSANVDDIKDRGFMYEWMESVTLDPNNRMYVLASDYYIDMVRAFFMIPVNKSMLEDIANKEEMAKVTGDRDKDGDIDLDDFYRQVKDGEWTYSLMMQYAAAAYQDDGEPTTTGKWLGDDYIGFAMADSGVATSGIIYTTSIKIIEKTWDTTTNDWKYYYPETATEFGKLATAIKSLMDAEGVVLVGSPQSTAGAWNDISAYNNNKDYLAIRNRFGNGNVLFGDIIMVGALEEADYQNMGKGAFGVLPVPLYHDNANGTDKYLTQIHNVGRPGAIAFNTKKFVECTAYLNYQSTNSSQILEDYYTFHLCSKIAGGGRGTVEMLDYLRNNVRTSFDKAMEDAMGVFDTNAKSYKMTYMLNSGAGEGASGAVDNYNVTDVTTVYTQWYRPKSDFLDTLVSYFKNATD